MGSGFEVWVYWYFFTITVNYNSSHIELLLNNVCFDESLWRISHESLTAFWLISTTPGIQSQSQSHIATDGQSVSKFWCRAPSGAHDQIFNPAWEFGLVFVGRTLWREDGSVFRICYWPLPAQSFSGPSPLGLAPVFETSLFVASYDS
jgi:hypothetical protein